VWCAIGPCAPTGVASPVAIRDGWVLPATASGSTTSAAVERRWISRLLGISPHVKVNLSDDVVSKLLY
jgi:hypothetical protein